MHRATYDARLKALGDTFKRGHDELVEGFPFWSGWSPCILYNAGAPSPFGAQLRRGTPAGPDIAYLGWFLSAECTLMVAAAFGREMAIAATFDDPEWHARIRAKITYAVGAK